MSTNEIKVTIKSKILNLELKYSFGPYPIILMICSTTKNIVQNKLK